MSKTTLNSVFLIVAFVFVPLVLNAQETVFVPTGGPTGGHVESLCEFNDTIYAGSAGGLFVYNKIADRWSRVQIIGKNNVDFTTTRVSQVTYKGEYLYILVKEAYVLRSKDKGHTWEDITGETLFTDYLRSANKLFFFQGKTLLKTDSEILEYNEELKKWEPQTTQFADYSLLDVKTAGDSLVYLSTGGSGVYCLKNVNETWTSMNQGLGNWHVTCLSATKELFAGTSKGIYKYNHAEAKWEDYPESQFANKSVRAIMVGSDNRILVCVDIWTTFLSVDNGESWTGVYKGLDPYGDSDVNVFLETQSTLYIGAKHWGVFASYDKGNTWFSRNNGLTAAYCKVLTIGNEVYSCGSGFYKYTPGNANSWSRKRTGHIGHFVASANGWIYTSVNNGLFIKSENGGNDWTGVNYEPVGRTYSSFETDKDDNLYVTGRSGIFKSADKGQTWDTISGNLTDFIEIEKVHAKLDGKLFASVAYIVQNDWKHFLYQTNSDTPNWQKINYDVNFDSDALEDITSTDSGLLIISDKELGLYFSSDTGKTWTRKELASYASPGYSAIETWGDSVIVASVNYDLMFSKDKGDTWHKLTANFGDLPNIGFSNYSFDADGNFYVGTWAQGIWKTSLLSSTEDPVGVKYPVTFQLASADALQPGEKYGVIGDWTNWSEAIRLVKDGDYYTATVDFLPLDYIKYKYVILNDKNEITNWEDVSGSCTTGSNNNRKLYVPYAAKTLDAVCYGSCENCSPLIVKNTVQNLLQIYPNPANNVLHINCMEAIEKISLTDISGKICMHSRLNNKFNHELQTKELARGIYVLSVKTNNHQIVKRVIVQ